MTNGDIQRKKELKEKGYISGVAVGNLIKEMTFKNCFDLEIYEDMFEKIREQAVQEQIGTRRYYLAENVIEIINYLNWLESECES